MVLMWLGAMLFIERMSRAIAVETSRPLLTGDVADAKDGDRQEYGEEGANPETVVYRISGAFFFGAAATVGSVLERIADRHRNFIIDCSGVPVLDSTAANVLEGAVRKANNANVRVWITGTSPHLQRMLITHGVKPPGVTYVSTTDEALAQIAAETRE